ncbi:primosomal protein N' [Chromatiales bacterium (ex Bugula neritina AB1)]|nr:primosomal protein N' [Chromatiales bacterium (ex Bugula neritina AB1)]
MPAGSLAVVKVAVAVPLSRVFDYLPLGQLKNYQPGARVLVSFGPGKKVGVVLGTGVSELAPARLKPVLQLLDTEPVLSEEIVQLVEWASGYYHHPVGECFAAALPGLLRKNSNAKPVPPCCYQATEQGKEAEADMLSRAPVQKRLLQFLTSSALAVTEGECQLFDPRWSAPMKELLKKGLAEKVWPDYSTLKPKAGFKLNSEQEAAATAAADRLGSYYPVLLYGITGSGKTEVYIDVARKVIERGQQVLLLLPEIGLTLQLLARFRSALACQVVAMHSAMNDTERLLAWQAAASGDAGVVIGTRSAIFTPMPGLALIVVDEEHDGSLKQQDGFRYHARDLALVRARRLKLPILLGSATPSLESLRNAKRGNFHLHRLTARAGPANEPQMILVDGRTGAGEQGLSQRLLTMMQEVLGRGEQVIVFINRRGYSPVLMCEVCSSIADCENCDAHMTVHARSGRLRCHHCGAERRVPVQCKVCEGTKLIRVGAGTERVDEVLSEKFPDYKLLRIDRDSTSRKGELQRHLQMAASGEAQILVGTQMLAKGHDFPNVTLVGIMDADRGLFGADFRSIEQMGQLIVQVAGRAGRARKKGTVLIQSQNTEHPLLHKLLDEGYSEFAAQLLEEREHAGWPPFAYVALLRADTKETSGAQNYLRQIAELAGSIPVAQSSEVLVLGPAHAPMERLAGRYRAQLLFVAAARKPLHQLLAWLRPTLEKLPSSRKVRWSIDVDPHDML